MSWPLSQDYNEAIQNPASSLSDPKLKGGEPVVNSMGLPIPRSGNFADVYQFRDSEGKFWALKCFTRQVKGLQARYAKIDEHLGRVKLPFTVAFNYLPQGIRIRGQSYPLLQMEWVEGFTFNDFLRQNADKTAYLESLFLMWVRLSKRLRAAEVAHADLQHGNVLLVPGSKASTLGLKLIDYDGMWVPSLADRPSGEAGHASYQHPARRTGIYSSDVDRFPHLIIACAIRSLIVGGPDLWAKFDNGDNLLFREEDIRNPGNSALIKTLWDLNDPIVRPLLGHLVLSTKKPIADTPWLDELMANAESLALKAGQRRAVGQMLPYAAETAAPPPVVHPWQPTTPDEVFAALALPAGDDLHASPARMALSLYWIIPLAAVAFGVLLLGVGLFLLLSDRKPETTTKQTTVERTTQAAQPPPIPTKPAPPPIPVEVEPVIEALAVMPRELPPPKLSVLEAVWSVPGSAATGCFDFTGDGRHLFAAPIDSEMFIVYNALDGKKLSSFDATVGKIRAICPAGTDRAILNGYDNESGLFDVLTGDRIRRFQTPQGDPTPFSASPDGMDAICPGDQGWQVMRYGLDTGMSNNSWTDPDLNVKVLSVRYSPDGSRWIAVDEDGRIRIHSLKGDDQATMMDPSKTDRFAILSATNRRLISFGKSAEIRIWDVDARTVLHTLPGHTGGVRDAVVTPDDRWVFSVGADRKLRVWDVATGREEKEFDLPEIASCIRLSSKGDLVSTASANGPKAVVQLWHVLAKPQPAE
jgi:hypothetical protein